ncbi:MAG: hypothetical protein JF597_49265 [Streptomyces sp.]|jgi:hypothetical protein|uniref:hypothetical protein n=1 Tax=Streptomyces sp. TaxID=1931 RepID=UPI0025CE639C|nr:hypothetical protein [Streptomyces sp.]MBW8801262.1 hypothetical protein [Streptomyces sp.]
MSRRLGEGAERLLPAGELYDREAKSMHGPGRDRHDDRDSLRFQMIELAANLLALLSILATMLVIVLAADTGPTVIAALATAVSVSFRAWLAYRHRHHHPGIPTPFPSPDRPRLPGPRRSLDQPAGSTAESGNETV